MSVVMPQLGESIVEATLARWLVQPGDSVSSGQILAEVETDKATNEIPAPQAGTVAQLLIGEGETVEVGTVILTFVEGAQSSIQTSPPPVPEISQSELPKPAHESVLRRRLPSQHLAPRPVSRTASPAVRRIAREENLDLDLVAGSGKNGRITRHDVLTHLQNSAAEKSTSAPIAAVTNQKTNSVYRIPKYKPKAGDESVPFTRRRQYISEHMVHSLGTAAHVAAVTEIDMNYVMKARSTDALIAQQRGIKLTITPYVVSAVAQALHSFPELNAVVDGTNLILRQERNLGVAVNTKHGLMVPVIRNADELGLLGIARSLARLTQKASQDTLQADDLSDGSFTISNPGKDGNLFGVSIIRQPEVGILRIGSIVKRPVVREIEGEDVVVVRPIMYAALSYDHRVIDGAIGNGFLSQIKALLEETQPLSESFLGKNQ
ncbi:MAG: dihydrolipoamide acetyltransferase family protein [Myxococcota bacterium]|nr:dihydrolipoamide acetyltransferase family protein [Myxococcota bacterium]